MTEERAVQYLMEIGYTYDEITDSMVKEVIEATYADDYIRGDRD